MQDIILYRDHSTLKTIIILIRQLTVSFLSISKSSRANGGVVVDRAGHQYFWMGRAVTSRCLFNTYLKTLGTNLLLFNFTTTSNRKHYNISACMSRIPTHPIMTKYHLFHTSSLWLSRRLKRPADLCEREGSHVTLSHTLYAKIR